MHVSYYDASTGDLLYALRTGSWSLEPVDNSGDDVGFDSAIAVDALGYPHISYQDGSVADLLYANRVSGSWDIAVVDDSFDSVGLYTSLALGPLGQPHISYQDGTGFDLYYASGPQELLAVGGPRPLAPGRDVTVSPNPATLGTRIRLAARIGEFTALRLFDVAGRFERQLDVGGAGDAIWDGRDQGGAAVRPGVHLVRPIRRDGSSGHSARVIIVH